MMMLTSMYACADTLFLNANSPYFTANSQDMITNGMYIKWFFFVLTYGHSVHLYNVFFKRNEISVFSSNQMWTFDKLFEFNGIMIDRRPIFSALKWQFFTLISSEFCCFGPQLILDHIFVPLLLDFVNNFGGHRQTVPESSLKIQVCHHSM